MRWSRTAHGPSRLGVLPFDLYGKTVLIVGFGRIGTRTAKRCQAMEMNVLVYDPYKPAAEIKAAGCEPVTDLDAALPRADFVTIHCPKTPETVGMFNAARFKLMKPTAYLVNTARGGIVDEKALHEALVSRQARRRRPRRVRAGAAAGQTTRCSACRTSSWRRTSPASRVEAVDRMSEQTARNILSALDGEPIRQNVINQDVL